MAITLLGKILLRLSKYLKEIKISLLKNYYYKNILGNFDNKFKIECNVEIRNPEKVSLGYNTYIRSHTILNGRTKRLDYGIILGPSTYIKGYCYIDAYGGYINMKGM